MITRYSVFNVVGFCLQGSVLTATIRVIPVCKNLSLLHEQTNSGVSRCEYTFVAKAKDPAHVGQSILLEADSKTIDICEHFTYDLCNGFVGVRNFIALDEVGILGESTGVKE